MALSRIAEAYVQVVPRIDGVATQMKTQLSSEMAAAGAVGGDEMAKGTARGFGSKIKGYFAPVAATFAASFAAVGVANFFKDSVNGASNFAEQGAAVGQVFGKAAGDIEKFASNAATSLGQSKTQILEASKQFGIYGKAAGLAGADNAMFSTELVKLATDLASFNNTSVDDAILALGSGLRGEAEPLRRFGVLLDDATLRQKALELGIVKSTKEALTPQQKVLAATASIFAQTSTQQGDFARTSEGLANQQRILTAQVENLKIGIGTALLPAMTNLASFANTHVIPAIKDLGQSIKDTVTWAKNNWDWLGPIVAGIGGAVAAFTAWKVAIGLWQAATKIAAGVQLAFNLVLAANPVMLIVTAVAALTAGLVYFFAQTKTGQEVWKAFTTFLSDAWKNITKSWDGLVKWFGDLPNKIGGFFKDAGTWLLNAGKNILEGLLNGLKNAAGAVGKFLGDIGKTWIDGFKAMFGIKSPSKLFTEFGRNIMQGLKIGLTGDADSVTAAMTKVSNFLIDSFRDKKLSAASYYAGRSLVIAFSGQLQQLATQHAAVMKQLEVAQDNLSNRLKEKTAFVQNIGNKYGAGAVIDAESTVETVTAKIEKQLADSKALNALGGKLLSMGLDQDLYKQIIENGAIQFAAEIVEGGQAAVTQLNVLADKADAEAMLLAENVGGVLFDQGIKFAQSVVDGLMSQKSLIETMMNTIADTFASRISDLLALAGSTAEKAAVASATNAAEKVAAKVSPQLAKTVAKVTAKAKAAPTTIAKKVTAPAVAKKTSSVPVNTNLLKKIVTGSGMKAFAKGGFVTGPTRALIGEAGPEVVTPLKDFERMMGIGENATKVVNYYAAPNASLDSEQALLNAIKRAKVVAAW